MKRDLGCAWKGKKKKTGKKIAPRKVIKKKGLENKGTEDLKTVNVKEGGKNGVEVQAKIKKKVVGLKEKLLDALPEKVKELKTNEVGGLVIHIICSIRLFHFQI